MTTHLKSEASLNDLPMLSEEYTLTSSDIAAYRNDGHVLLRAVASPSEIDVYGRAIRDAAAQYNPEKRSIEERDTYGKAFLQIMNLWQRDEIVRRYTLSRRFAKIAADLMGVDGVRIYHDQALFKEPHGGATPWHQDQYYWPLDTDRTVTMWMPLVDVTAEMGALIFASSSFRDGYLGELKISDESDKYFDALVRERGFALKQCAMAAGDATFHSGWTLHSAPGNNTDRMRAAMTIIYMADGARVIEPDNENRKDDLHTWLPGSKRGDFAATALNPVVYCRSEQA